MNGHIGVRRDVVLDFYHRGVFVALAQIGEEHVGDQSPLVDQSAAAVGSNAVVHGKTWNVITRGRFAASVFQHLGHDAVDSRNSKRGGGIEGGLGVHVTAGAIAVLQILANRCLEVAIKLPLAGHVRGGAWAADVKDVLLNVHATGAFGKNQVHFIGREGPPPNAKVIQPAVD